MAVSDTCKILKHFFFFFGEKFRNSCIFNIDESVQHEKEKENPNLRNDTVPHCGIQRKLLYKRCRNITNILKMCMA